MSFASNSKDINSSLLTRENVNSSDITNINTNTNTNTNTNNVYGSSSMTNSYSSGSSSVQLGSYGSHQLQPQFQPQPQPHPILVRLQSFLDAGYEFEMSVKLTNINPSEFPSPPIKFRTNEQMLNDINTIYARVMSSGFILNGFNSPPIPNYQQQTSSSSGSGIWPSPSSSSSFPSVPTDSNNNTTTNNNNNNNSRVVVEVHQSGPKCSFNSCQNIAITRCGYTGSTGDSLCDMLVCVEHGMRVTLLRTITTMCPHHAEEVRHSNRFNGRIGSIIAIGSFLVMAIIMIVVFTSVKT